MDMYERAITVVKDPGTVSMEYVKVVTSYGSNRQKLRAISVMDDVLKTKNLIKGTEIKQILPILVGYTLDCPNVYYNHEKNTIRFIILNTPIEWNNYEFKWTCDWTTWENSSTLKIIFEKKEYALLEFQFHTKSRTNMAIRWHYEHFLTIFKENLFIIDI
jgi:hypothetical protein